MHDDTNQVTKQVWSISPALDQAQIRRFLMLFGNKCWPQTTRNSHCYVLEKLHMKTYLFAKLVYMYQAD